MSSHAREIRAVPQQISVMVSAALELCVRRFPGCSSWYAEMIASAWRCSLCAQRQRNNLPENEESCRRSSCLLPR